MAAARTLAGRLVAAKGTPLASPDGGLTHLFPQAEDVADVADGSLSALGMPAARRAVLSALASALATGEVVIDAGADRTETTARLLDIPGVGPWTSAYITMRGLGDPDVFLPTDLGVRHAFERLGLPSSPHEAAAVAERWRPWRSYAVMHLWRSL